jgi:addiction module HigA family antidote
LWIIISPVGGVPEGEGHENAMNDRRFTLQPDEVFEYGRLPSIHPGEVLREEFLEPLGLTAYQLAKTIGVEQTRVSEILHGKRGITADTALRLARFFGTSAQMWMNLQSRYELEEAQHKLRTKLEEIRPREPAAF